MTAGTRHASWRADDDPSTTHTTRRPGGTPRRSRLRGLVALGTPVLLAAGLVACGSDDGSDATVSNLADDASDDTSSASASAPADDADGSASASASAPADDADGSASASASAPADDADGSASASASAPADDADGSGASASEPATEFSGTLRVGAIPDQDPEVLQRQFELVTDHLVDELGVEVEYIPVSDYQSAVSGFAVGDLDFVWFGALTGIQARLEVDGAQAILQRDIDADFTSVFVVNTDTGIEPFDDVAGLEVVAGRSFTFGSDSSTSGRLMPQFFLGEAGVDVETDLTGPPGFSGSHDATIEVVTAGTYEVGAVASQVWDTRLADGEVDTDRVIEVFRTPPYPNYHWVAQPGLDDTFGDGFQAALVEAFTSLDASDADEAEILELFGAGSFIPTENANYDPIEVTARDVGLIR